jgi:hypothetical protein
MSREIKDSISSFLQARFPGTDSEYPGLIPVTGSAVPDCTLIAAEALGHAKLNYGPPGSISAALGNRSLRFAARLGDARMQSALPDFFDRRIIPRKLSGSRFCMASNPLQYLPGFYQEPGCVPWSKVGSAEWCIYHRIAIAAENCLRNSLNGGLQEQIVHVTKHIRCPYYWPSIEAIINLLLKIGFDDSTLAERDMESSFFADVETGIKAQYESGKGVHLDDVLLQIDIDPIYGVEPPKTCALTRWGTVTAAAARLEKMRRLFAIGVLRRSSRSTEVELVRACIAVFSHQGFVSSDHPNLQLDKNSTRSFLMLTSAGDRAQLAIMRFVDVLFVKIMLKWASAGYDCGVADLMGQNSLIRSLLRIFSREIWVRPSRHGWSRKLTIGHRSDGAEYYPKSESMRLLNPKCDVNALLGDAGNEETKSAVKELLECFKEISQSPGPVLPQDLLDALQKAYPDMYSSGGKYSIDQLNTRPSNASVTWSPPFAANMSQLQLMTFLVCKNIVASIRRNFDRELYSLKGWVGGLEKSCFSKYFTLVRDEGTSRERILSADPTSLANASILISLFRDLTSHHQETLGNEELSSFLPDFGKIFSKGGLFQLNRFLGTDSSKWGQHFHSLAEHILADSDGELLFDVQEHAMPASQFSILADCAGIAVRTVSASKPSEQFFSITSSMAKTKGSAAFHTFADQLRRVYWKEGPVGAEEPLPASLQNLNKIDEQTYFCAEAVGQLSGWKKSVFAEDALKRDAMTASHKQDKLPKKIADGGHWKSTNHEGGSRTDRFSKPPPGSAEFYSKQRAIKTICDSLGRAAPKAVQRGRAAAARAAAAAAPQAAGGGGVQ